MCMGECEDQKGDWGGESKSVLRKPMISIPKC